MRGPCFPSCPGAHTTLGFEGGRGQPRWAAAGKGLPVPLAPGRCWGCICCWMSALSPPQLWHNSSAEPQPQSVLCHCIPVSPPCLALLFSAILDWLWEPWIFPGLCQLLRAGLVCPQQKRRGWGDDGRALCCGRAPPTPQSPSCTGRTLTPLGSPQRSLVEERPSRALAAPCPVSQCSALPFFPAGV